MNTVTPSQYLPESSGDTTRIILRPTCTYALLLQESLHPDLLRDPADRQRLIKSSTTIKGKK